MSNYPEQLDVFVNKTGSDNIASSDPNNAFDGVEATQALIGALGKPASWSTTLLTALREHQDGMRVEITAGVLKVRAGEAMLESTDGNRLVFRRNVSDVTLGAANLDAGTLAATTYYIYAKGDSAATTGPIVYSTDPLAPSGIGTAPFKRLGWFENAGAGSLTPTFGGNDQPGAILSIINTQTGAFSTGSTAIPDDDTIPQNNEGDEYMSIVYAPRNANNKLKIDVVINAGINNGAPLATALFQDGTADALASSRHNIFSTNLYATVSFTHFMTAGTTRAITFSVRVGQATSNTIFFNGDPASGARRHGGVLASSITVTEIAG